MLVDLSTLPAPSIVEELSFEAIFAAHKADLLQRYPAAADVIDLESEPLNKLMQAHAYRELLYRQRVNEAARSYLLAYARGSDLDHKGAFFDVPRLAGEADDRYRVRIQLRIASLAANGTAEQYRLTALTASQNIFDAAVSTVVLGTVNVVLWLVDASQAEATLSVAMAALNAPGARPLGIGLTVSLARPRPINVTATLWRETSAPTNLIAQIREAFPTMLTAYARLGQSVGRSWVTTRLHVDGIVRVQFPDALAPPDNTVLAADEYPVPGLLLLTDGGTA